MSEALLTPPEAVAYLRANFGVRRTVATLAKHRVVAGGPPFRRLGRSILYAPADLDAWADDALRIVRTSTSDLGQAAA
jgi:hypothetical protein